MNAQLCKNILTHSNLQTATLVLYALDTLLEIEFLEHHEGPVRKRIKSSEADISALAAQTIKEFPALAMMLNGHGHRLLTTNLVNCLTSVGLQDQSKIVLDYSHSLN